MTELEADLSLIPTAADYLDFYGSSRVRTGGRTRQILGRVDVVPVEQKNDVTFAEFSVVRYVIHTHNHIDHAGQDNRFPMPTTLVVNQRESEYSSSGSMDYHYPPEYVNHHIDRLHTTRATRLLDLELSEPDEIVLGVICESAGGYSEGSMNINAQTAEGIACICSDAILDIQNQVIEPTCQLNDYESNLRAATGQPRGKKATVKKAFISETFVLPVHDYPARADHGRVISIRKDSVPAPKTPVVNKTARESGVVACIRNPVGSEAIAVDRRIAA